MAYITKLLEMYINDRRYSVGKAYRRTLSV